MMSMLFEMIESTFLTWSESILGVPAPIALSRSAVFSSPALIRSDAKSAAKKLSASLSQFQLFGSQVFSRVEEQNGWLLFSPGVCVLDAYAGTLRAIAPGEAIRRPEAGYLDYRMDMLLRYGDAPLPDYEPLIRAVFCASYASAKDKWTREAEQTVLTMLHGLKGFERVKTEQRCGRAAKIILLERMEMNSRSRAKKDNRRNQDENSGK